MFSSLKSLATSSAIKAAYNISDDSGFSAGAWQVQDAVKKSTKQEVSVLTFSKKSLEQPLQRTSSSLRQSFDAIYTQLKNEAATLARLRHPAMLEVVEPIEESRSSIIFVTERITGCLASMVNDEEGDSTYSRRARGDANKLDEVEIQKGLLQVTIGLEFLQSVAQMVHGNLVPESIFINAKGDWKLGGFSFAIALKDSARYIPPDYDNRLPKHVQRNLDYAAPEFIIDETIDPLNDMFSLGCLICALVSSKRQSIIQCQQNIHLYRKAVDNLNLNALTGVPPYLRDVLPQLLTRRPANRLSANAFQSSPFFDNLLMNSIRFLDSFPEKTTSERQSFMRGLQTVIPQFPPRVLNKKILPGLLDQFQDHQLLPLILPNIFLIAEGMTQKNFSDSVLPKLRTVLKITDSPASTMFLLEKMSVLRTKVTAQELKEDVMTLIYTALTGDTQYIQEKALKVSADLVKDLDLVTIKTALFPKIAEVFTHTTMLGIKVTALETFNVLVLQSLDKYTVIEKLVPLIKGIKTKEPAVAMAALALSSSCGAKVDHENIALDLLPQLWSMSLSPLLTQDQFKLFMTAIKDLSKRVEMEQAKKLSDSGAPAGTSMQVSSGDLMDDGASARPEDISFENLVLGSKQKPTAPMHQAASSVWPSTAENSTGAAFSWSTPAQPPAPQRQPVQTTLSSYPTLQPVPNTGSYPSRPVGLGQISTHSTTPQSTGANTPNYNISSTAGLDWSSNNRSAHQNYNGMTNNTTTSITSKANQFNWGTPQVAAAPYPNTQNAFPPPPQAPAKKGLDAYQSLL